MKPEREQQVERLCRAALERQPSDRADFLAEACAGDEILRREVESLLRFHEPTEDLVLAPGSEFGVRPYGVQVQARSKVGRQLGSYEILSLLGAGGMGEIYRARDLRLDREVAIKLLPDHLAQEPAALARFQREARALAALSHPNILAIHDVVTEQGVLFAVTELLEGETLRNRLKRAAPPWRQAVDIAAAIADALAAAHAKGIVHRDLKPENIFLTSDGRVKLLDFGIALKQPLALPDAIDSGPAEPGITQPGMLIGTIGYMSPEQVRGERADPRSDIFSLGCVLYEMVTGRSAFARASAQETIAAILRDRPVSLHHSGVDAPPILGDLIMRCLEKRPESRVQSARDLALELRTLAGESARRRTRWRVPLAAAAVSLAIGIAAATAWFSRERDDREPLIPVPLTSYPGDEVQPSFSPDGNQVVFVWNGEREDNPDLYVKLIGGSEKPLRLTSNPAPDLSPAWSPDGRFIAFLRAEPGAARGTSVLVIPAIGGPERIVTQLGSPLWSPAGLAAGHERIAPFPLLTWADTGSLVITDHSSRNDPLGLFIVSLDTGNKRRLTSPPPGFIGDAAPALSPDGRTLLFSRAAGLTVSELYELPLTSDLHAAGEPQQLTSSNAWNLSPAWLPGGREFVFSRGSWHAGPFSLWRMPAFPRAVPHRLPGVTENSSFAAVAPGTGRLVFSRNTGDSNIWRVPLRNRTIAGNPEKLIVSTRDEAVPQYSPDGRRIVFTSNRTGFHEVWLANSDGSDPVQITSFRAGLTGSPHWSPDGSRVVFDCNASGQFEIYVVDVAGGQPRRLTNHLADDALASFSPDDRFVYFTSNRSGDWQVWRMLANGTEQVQITRAGGRSPLVSSDGKRLWYEKAAELWSMPVEGGNETQILKSVGFLNTALTDKGIYFIARCGGVRCPAIEYLDLATGKSTPVIDIGGRLEVGLTIAPDRNTLLYTRIDQSGQDLMLVDDLDRR